MRKDSSLLACWAHYRPFLKHATNNISYFQKVVFIAHDRLKLRAGVITFFTHYFNMLIAEELPFTSLYADLAPVYRQVMRMKQSAKIKSSVQFVCHLTFDLLL